MYNPGMMPHPNAGMMPTLGSAHYPPTFSYAQPYPHPEMGLGMGMGASLAGGAVGAAGGLVDAANKGLMGVGAIQGVTGIASMLGLMKAPLLSTGFLGAATGASLGGMTGIGLSMLGGPLGIGLSAIGGGISVARQGISNANQVSSLFGNMQFANGGGDPRTGRGFSQQDLATLQRGITNISANNPFISMTDAMRTADRFTEAGMHQGIQDAEKLAKKVTQLGKSLHEMARHLGTSMEESGTIFKQMKNAGYYNQQDVMGNVQNMTLMRGYGMSSEQFSQMQMAGAGITRSAQMSGRAGAGMLTSKTADFMSLIKTGKMDATEMMDITGASTPLEAAQLMAQQTLAGTMQGLQGGLGTAMLLAMGKTDRSGKFTGEVDATVMDRMRSGKMTRSEMLEIGAGKRSTRQGQVSFMAKRQDISETLLESEQAQEALFGMVKSLARQLGGEGAGEDEDFLQLVAETQMNIDRRTFRALQKLSETRQRRATESLRELRTNERAAILKEERSLGGLYTKITGTFNDALMTPMAAAASEGYRETIGAFADLERKFLGSNDVTMAASSRLLEDFLVGSDRAVEGTNSAGIKVTLGDTARAASMQGNFGLFEEVAGSMDTGQYRAKLDRAFNSKERLVKGQGLENYLAGIREGGISGRLGFADKSLTEGQLREIAVKAGINTQDLDSEKLLAAIAQSGGDIGMEMAAEAALSLGTGGGTERSIELLQKDMRASLSSPSLFTLDEENAILGVGGLSFLFDSAGETARSAISQGGDAADLLSQYEDKQQEIDLILSGGVDDPKRAEKAAQKLSKAFGLKLTAEDVRNLDTALKEKTGKKAFERAQAGGVDPKVKKDIAGAARRLVQATAGEKFDIAQRSLVTASGRQFSGSLQEQLQMAIQDAAERGLTADTTDDAATRTLAYGGDVFKKLQSASTDGLTRSELKSILPFDDDTIDKLLVSGGAEMQGGAITAADQTELSKFLASKAATSLSLSSEQETFLNAGLSPMERQSLSVQKTAELVDKLYRDYLKIEPGTSNPEG